MIKGLKSEVSNCIVEEEASRKFVRIFKTTLILRLVKARKSSAGKDFKMLFYKNSQTYPSTMNKLVRQVVRYYQLNYKVTVEIFYNGGCESGREYTFEYLGDKL